MTWRGGTLVTIVLAAVAAIATATVLAVGPPRVPIQPIGAPTSTGSTTIAGPDVAVTVSSKQAGAKPVALSVAFDASLICGRPRGATTITLPQAATVPDAVAARDVTINGRAAGKVTVHDSTVTITPAPVRGMSCQSIVLGTMHVGFTRAAGIGNPAASGSYAVVVHRDAQVLRGTLTILG